MIEKERRCSSHTKNKLSLELADYLLARAANVPNLTVPRACYALRKALTGRRNDAESFESASAGLCRRL